jgi:glutaredoxin domain-containing cysteine-rich protein 1
MRGLRSRILRTLQSAAAQTNVLLPSPAAPPEKCHILHERAPSPVPAGAEAAPEPPTVSDVGRDGDGDKENASPEANPRKAKKMKVSADDGAAEAGLCYRRPELESVTLFDPDLLAAFRGVVDAYTQALEKSAKRYPAYDEDDDDIAAALEEGGAGVDPLAGFETRCPPGGERAVVLYTTSLRGVRKTFEDCATVRRLLDGLRVAFLERDVSMHAPYRDELRALLRDAGAGAMPLPPRLFVDGRYVGGADEVVALHERSRLRPMLRRAARRGAGEAACAVCGGAWFVVCGGCSGRHWLYDGGAAAAAIAANRVPCPGCNENGLVPCPLCS